jgi:iron complex outermembrane receptor protein
MSGDEPSISTKFRTRPDGIPNNTVNISNLFDIKRIEVLAGPQGTLFGDSVSAGLINVITVAPSTAGVSGKIATEFSGRDTGNPYSSNGTVRAALNVPLSSDAAVRVSAYGLKTTGPEVNIFTHKKAADQEAGIRSRFLWRPERKLTINVIGDWNYSHTANNFFVYTKTPSGGVLSRSLAKCGVSPSVANLSSCGSDPTKAYVHNWGVSEQVDYKLDNGSAITYLSGFRRQTTMVDVDVDGLPAGLGTLQIFSGPETHPANYLTQELHLTSAPHSKFAYVVGIFYSHFHGYHAQPGQVTVFGHPSPSFQSTNTTKVALGLFGQGTYHVTRKLAAVVGARLNHSELTDFYYQINVRPGLNLGSGLRAKINDPEWRLGLQYQVDAKTMTYFTATRGYKGPQANDLNPLVSPELIQPERPLYFEAGVKNNLLSQRLALDVDVYSADIVNYQGQYCPPPTAFSPTTICQPQNIPGVRIHGVEASVFGSPLNGLTLNVGAAYNVARYPSGYYSADGSYLGGDQLAYAPVFKGTFVEAYTHPINGALDWKMALDAVYTSAIRESASGLPGVILPAHWMIGGRIGVVTDRWEVALYVRNLLNYAEPVAMGTSPTQIGDPAYHTFWAEYGLTSRRQIGVAVNYDF